MPFRRSHALVFFAALCGLCALARADEASPAISRTPPADATTSPQPGRRHVFGAETNYSPLWAGQTAPATPANPTAAAGPAVSWSALGPLIFRKPLEARPRFDDGAVLARGFRPLYIEKRDASGRLAQFHVLYPLFNWRRVNDDGYRWDILTLINHEHGPATRATAKHDADNQFDIWPFYFSNQTGDPATSYRAIFPLHGNVSHRLLQDRLGWYLFPIYGWSERNGTTTRAVLWPVFRRSTGAGVDGWKIWPLAGHETKRDTKTGALIYDNTLALWPFYFNNKTFSADPDDASRLVSQNLGVLPFYLRETAPGLRSESYMLFFGYTRRTAPYLYSENRYLWPLFVQGRGDSLRINRWAPFYTHSFVRGREKTWIMWPLWKHSRWDDTVLAYEKKQFFYFLYNSVSQKPLVPALPADATPAEKNAHARLATAKPARKISLWPLYTYWTDGAGRRQFQTLSPFEVFLPQNEPTRLIYTPLFALYKYEQGKPGHTRHTALWNFVSYRREPELREFHLGPLYSGERLGEHKRRALLCGVLGMEKAPGKGWRPFAFRFKSLQQRLAETSGSAALQLGTTARSAAPENDAVENAIIARAYPQVHKRR